MLCYDYFRTKIIKKERKDTMLKKDKMSGLSCALEDLFVVFHSQKRL